MNLEIHIIVLSCLNNICYYPIKAKVSKIIVSMLQARIVVRAWWANTRKTTHYPQSSPTCSGRSWKVATAVKASEWASTPPTSQIKSASSSCRRYKSARKTPSQIEGHLKHNYQNKEDIFLNKHEAYQGWFRLCTWAAWGGRIYQQK